ncbi:hypothetical protein Pint_07018 [Pistacia integerrima]|uniref:Uncharacterized protein n=1 Tax=Pistacia integerrima TaxID=434235 RepID=A0ACC0XXN1_9ROSI|nr:hypothetical protein Pint_07018 [Pistacia integerrima]
MASTFTPQAPYSLFLKRQNSEKLQRREEQQRSLRRSRTKHGILQVFASKGRRGQTPQKSLQELIQESTGTTQMKVGLGVLNKHSKTSMQKMSRRTSWVTNLLIF